MRHVRRAVLVVSFLAGLGVVLALAHLDARVRAYLAGIVVTLGVIAFFVTLYRGRRSILARLR